MKKHTHSKLALTTVSRADEQCMKTVMMMSCPGRILSRTVHHGGPSPDHRPLTAPTTHVSRMPLVSRTNAGWRNRHNRTRQPKRMCENKASPLDASITSVSTSTTSTVYWCIASKLKAPRNFYWMSNMFLWVEIFLFFVCYHVVPKRHSQLDYELNGL